MNVITKTYKQFQICLLLFFMSFNQTLKFAILFNSYSDGKASACSAGDRGSIPGSGRSPGEGNGNPLQHSCLENPMDGGAWKATVHGVTKSRTRLSDFTFHFLFFILRAPAEFTGKEVTISKCLFQEMQKFTVANTMVKVTK